MKLSLHATILATVLALPFATSAAAETPDEWIALGARVHGAFGAFIPIGIRIGLDALERLKAEPRSLAVSYYSGTKAPCPCIADGVMLATRASPGQGTLQVMGEKAPAGALAVVIIRDRKGRAGVRYAVKDEWLPKVVEWNRALDPAGRYQAVMAADGLFEAAPAP
jgi:formylmethanofuran dehydrogenase subunit E